MLADFEATEQFTVDQIHEMLDARDMAFELEEDLCELELSLEDLEVPQAIALAKAQPASAAPAVVQIAALFSLGMLAGAMQMGIFVLFF